MHTIPTTALIRIVLDNHVTQHPGRFEYMHTPKHASWLHLVEVSFSRMARTFLRHLRVASLDQLKHRIRQGIDEMNAMSVPY